MYSGKVAAEGYSEIPLNRYQHVILLGPSHRHYFKGIAESEETRWETPLGLTRIQPLNHHKIIRNSDYHRNEHCLEVHIPFIKSILPEATVSPLLLSGSYSNAKEYAKVLARFDSDDVLWIVSSDFNHTGPNFQHNPSQFGYESGEEMDLKAIEFITEGDINGFIQFLEETKATICGALPIIVIMYIAKHLNNKNFVFKRYDCSGRQTNDINSVGYATLYC